MPHHSFFYISEVGLESRGNREESVLEGHGLSLLTGKEVQELSRKDLVPPLLAKA